MDNQEHELVAADWPGVQDPRGALVFVLLSVARVTIATSRWLIDRAAVVAARAELEDEALTDELLEEWRRGG
jgi:hypothetical protein